MKLPRYQIPLVALETLGITAFCMMAVMGYYLVCMASLVATATTWDPAVLLAVTLCAAVPTLWLAHRLHREVRIRDPIGSVPRLLACQLWLFLTALRVPVLLSTVGSILAHQRICPVLGWLLTIPLAIWLPSVLRWLFRYHIYSNELLRGTELLSPDQLRAAVAAVRIDGERSLDWSGIALPERFSSGHFAISGATASGKTTLMRLLMQSVIPQIRPGSDQRAFIYDAKQDVLSILSGMRPHVPVITLNPFDKRSAAWDIAKDITSVATALQIAHTLIADEQGSNAFFVKAARDMLAAVFVGLHVRRPGDWTFAEAVLILSDSNCLKALLMGLLETSHIAREHFCRDPRTLANVLSTISANMAMLRPIAALWSHAKQKISLTRWVQSESILVLGNDEQLRAPIDAVNRVIFQRVTELILAQSESRERRSWFFVDEVKEAGKLDSLPRLLTKGRSKGVRAVLAWQTIEGLRAVYGDHLADELAGMCANKAFLRTDSPETAIWAAKIIGEMELREWTRSVQRGASSSSTQAEHIVKREAVLASQIMRLPLADQGKLCGYFVTPGVGVYRNTVAFSRRLMPLGRVPDFIPRPAEDQYLYDDKPAAADSPQGDPDDGLGRDPPHGR